MDSKTFLYGVFVGVLAVGFIGIINFNSLNGRIDGLEVNLTELKIQLEKRDTQVETMLTHSQTLSASIDKLNASYIKSQMNCSSLKATARADQPSKGDRGAIRRFCR